MIKHLVLGAVLLSLVGGLPPAQGASQAPVQPGAGSPRLKVIPVGPRGGDFDSSRLQQEVLRSIFETAAGRFRVLPFVTGPELETLLNEQYNLYAFQAQLNREELQKQLREKQGSDLVLFVGVEKEFVSSMQEHSRGSGRGYFVRWFLDVGLPPGISKWRAQAVRRVGPIDTVPIGFEYMPFSYQHLERSREATTSGWMLLLDLRSYEVLYMGREERSASESLTLYQPLEPGDVFRRIQAGKTPCWGGPSRVLPDHGWPGRRRHSRPPSDYVRWWSADEVQRLYARDFMREPRDLQNQTRAELGAWVSSQTLLYGARS